MCPAAQRVLKTRPTAYPRSQVAESAGGVAPPAAHRVGGAATGGLNGIWESVNFVSSPSMGGVQCSGGVVQGAVSSRRYLSTRASVLQYSTDWSTMPRTSTARERLIDSSCQLVHTRSYAATSVETCASPKACRRGSFYQALCYEISVPRRTSGGGCRWGERIDSDAIAQTLQSFDQTASDLLAVVFVKVVGAEIDIRTVVLE